MNSVNLMGRLVSDPELKTTNSGISVTSFRIAVDRGYVKAGEERKADFIDIVAWRNTAEFVCRYFGKGDMIALSGRLQTRTYQAKDGTNRSVIEVLADNVFFTGERHSSSPVQAPVAQAPVAQAPVAQAPVAQAPAAQAPATFEEPLLLDDDLPF